MYQCPLCDENFTRSSSLKYHTIHKVCQKTTDKMCPKCGYLFSTKQMCQYHISHNVCNTDHATPITTKPKLVLKSNYEQMSREELIHELTHVTGEFNHMKGKYEALKENPQQINNIVVFPASFGDENMEHISQKLGDILKPMIINHPFRSIPLLFDRIHNNDKLPEYHNVYVSSERSNYAMISDGKNFKYTPKKTIIDQIIEDKRSILNRYVDDNGKQLGEEVLAKYEKYQNRLDDNSEFRKTLEVEIGCLLLNMKSVIANDEKTRQLLDKVNDGQYELTQ